MILIFARAARCSWVTTKDLLLTFAGKRSMSPDDLSRASSSFNRLSPETAQRIITFRLEPLQTGAPSRGKISVLPVAPLRPEKP